MMAFLQLLTFITAICLTAVMSEESTLQMVHVLFRHGDRTNEGTSIYPKDPYINETYYPIGKGQLTNRGKRRMYALGQKLRKRYHSFLGNVYSPDILEASSSDYARTKASLMLVLAALFPPIGDQVWLFGMKWQPIPINFLKVKEDTKFFGVLCPNARKLIAAHLATPKYRDYFKTFSNLTDYLEKHTGSEINSMFSIALIYERLCGQDEMNMILPAWTKHVYPTQLKELISNYYFDITFSPEILKYSAGYMLKKILKDTVMKLNGQLPAERKLYLLSGHEMNCAVMLRLLGIFTPHIPPYAAHIIFELHKINGVYGYKIYYQDYSAKYPKIQILPGCDIFCPIDQFINLYQKYLPDGNTKCRD